MDSPTHTNPTEHLAAHHIRSCNACSPRQIGMLKDHFGTYARIHGATHNERIQAGLDARTAEALQQHYAKTKAEQYWTALVKEGISLLLPTDPQWPSGLNHIAHAPRMLYVRGIIARGDTLSLAVVGTRKITTYGRTTILTLIPPLAQSGLGIVSGLAFGVDAAAHEATIQAGGYTIAVLGSGLDERSLYPKAHTLLADSIIAHNGALISEYPPGTPALKQNFIARNRIISGMSQGVLVIESGIHSGSLITANYALEQGRRVYAVPGPIHSVTSQGTNNLLKLGATPVTEATDVLVDLNIPQSPTPQSITNHVPELSPTERQILDILTKTPVPIDEIVLSSQLDVQQCQTTLTFLELKGVVKNMGAGQYIRL